MKILAKFRKLMFYIVITLILILLAVFFITYKNKLSRIVTPFLLSIPVVYIVKPLAARLVELKIPVGLSILAVYLAFLIILAVICVFFIPALAVNIRELMETIPGIITKYETAVAKIFRDIKLGSLTEDIKNVIYTEMASSSIYFHNYFAEFLENGISTLIDIAKVILDLVIAMVISYYVIKDSEKLRDYALSLLPRNWRNGFANIGREINQVLKCFIQGQLLTALIVGILETIGLLIVDVKYPLALGLIGGLANIIPYFGPFIGAVPALAFALTISPLKAVWTLLVFLVVQQIDNNFISPKIIESKLGIHPVATIFAVLLGGELFGIPGMFLAVPVMAILRIIFNKLIETIV